MSLASSLPSSLTDEQWFDIIDTLSLLAAAGFGLLALLTDYKKDGRITLWGRVAAAGIVVSAVMSIASGIFKDRIEAGKAKVASAEREKADRRFRRQLTSLTKLENDMTVANARNIRIIAAMQRSNTAQRRLALAQSILLTQAQSSFRLTTKLDREQRASSQRVLLGLWNEASRIEPSRVELMVSVDCELAEGQKPPEIFREGGATVIVSKKNDLFAPRPPASASVGGGLQLEDFASMLLSYDPSFKVFPVEGGQTVTFFRNFLSFAPEGIADPEKWRNASIRLMVFGKAPDGFDTIRWREKWSWDGSGPTDLPCKATMLVTANDRMIGGDTGRMNIRRAEGEIQIGVEGEVDVEYNTFPRYEGADPQVRARTAGAPR